MSIQEWNQYSCDLCDYQATVSAHLNRHKQSIHEGKKVSCEFCDYKTTRREHLTAHNCLIHATPVLSVNYEQKHWKTQRVIAKCAYCQMIWWGFVKISANFVLNDSNRKTKYIIWKSYIDQYEYPPLETLPGKVQGQTTSPLGALGKWIFRILAK